MCQISSLDNKIKLASFFAVSVFPFLIETPWGLPTSHKLLGLKKQNLFFFLQVQVVTDLTGTVKLKRPLKRRPNVGFQDPMFAFIAQVKSIAEFLK